MLNKKLPSVLIILLIYTIAFGAGYYLFRILTLNPLLNFLIADVAATIIVYLFSLIFRNASIYDPYWSVLPMAAIPLFYNYQIQNQFFVLVIIVIALIEVWGLRLTINWLISFKNLKTMDWRYMHYKEKHPKLYPLINLFGIQLMPTLIVYLIMLSPISLLQSLEAENFTHPINLSSILAFIICLTGIVLEIIADAQMNRQRKKEPGVLHNKGLWRYSRHPNYLGEILFWLGMYLMLVSVNDKMWVLFAGPVVLIILFGFISIPLMEKHLIKKYPEYEIYQKETNMLLLGRVKRIEK